MTSCCAPAVTSGTESGPRPAAGRRHLGAAVGAARASALGLEKVLVTCDDANLASAQVIMKADGVLEDVRPGGLRLTRRYWITL